MRMGKLGILAAAVVGVCSLGAQVKADSIDPIAPANLVETNLGGGLYQYSINMKITGGNSVATNDSFSLFNVALATDTVTGVAPAGWTVSTPLTSFYSQGATTSTDGLNAALTDIRFDRSGSLVSAPSGDVDLGTFTFTSGMDLLGLGVTTIYGGAQYHNTPTGGTAQVNGITLTVTAAAVPTPEAAFAGMGTLGLLGAIAFMRRRSLSCA